MNFLFPYMARWKAINWSRYHQIFTRLAQMGHKVYILQPPPANIKETNFQEIEVDLPDNLILLDMPVNQFFWNLKLPFNKLIKKGYYSIISKRKIKEITKTYAIDVLFLYNIPQYPLMKGTPCFTVFDVADDYLAMLEHELGVFSNPMILNFAERILRKMVSKADLTLVVSQVLAENIRQYGGNIKELPNGAESPSVVIKKRVINNRKSPVVGFIGAFEYFIDFPLILDLAEKLPGMSFLLVGAGREFAWVKEQVVKRDLKNMILTGAVPHSEIYEYINSMDICLNIFKKIPISHGASPIKLFEYLAMKKPVISTRLKELEKINDNFIFFGDNVEECVRLIKSLIESPELGMKYAQKGYDRVQKEYRWDIITDKIMNSIKNIQDKKHLINKLV